MLPAAKKMECKSLSADYGVHFSTVLYPLSLIEIVESLEKLGYEISPSIPSPRPIGRFVGTGEFGRKGKSSVHVDAGAQALMVSNVSLKSALDSFNEVVSALSEDHKIDVLSMVRFYRFTANYEIRTEKKRFSRNS